MRVGSVGKQTALHTDLNKREPNAMKQIDKDLLQRCRKLSTSALSDVLGRMGFKSVTLDSAIKPVVPNVKIVGPAFTVHCYAGATHACEMAVEKVGAGEVLVIDGEGYTEAVLWGGIFSKAAQMRGAAGTVVDGAARDVDDIRTLGYPVFARSMTPRAGTIDSLGTVGGVISCGGVVVRPGDWVVGDDVGIVIVPQEKVTEAVSLAEAVEKKEAHILSLLDAGISFSEAVRQAVEAAEQ